MNCFKNVHYINGKWRGKKGIKGQILYAGSDENILVSAQRLNLYCQKLGYKLVNPEAVIFQIYKNCLIFWSILLKGVATDPEDVKYIEETIKYKQQYIESEIHDRPCISLNFKFVYQY